MERDDLFTLHVSWQPNLIVSRRIEVKGSLLQGLH